MIKHLRLTTQGDMPTIDESTKKRFQSLELPAFQTHTPNLQQLHDILTKYQKYQNIIILSNGGSRTSALAFWQSLLHKRNGKTFEFVSSMEPDVIAVLKKNYSPDNTLVMPISKSGTNVDVLEPLLQFLDYPILALTSPEKGLLYDLAHIQGWDIVPHPEVGGRYSGRSETGFAPAQLMGLDVEKINAGAVQAYESLDYNADPMQNIALMAALFCKHQEDQGKVEIFTPIYSKALAGFLPLIVQLIHESTGKNGKGQTIFGDEAPESQHHTNQRFFGGRPNVMGWFVTVKKQEHSLITEVPEKFRELPLGDGTLSDLDGIHLEDALRYDYEGVREEAVKRNIPTMTLEVDRITEESIGEFLSFLHYFTVYSALLRDQDPFDQPAVEGSKKISLEKRRRHAQVNQ